MSKPLTVGALRASLAHLGPNHDDRPIEVWLPGSRIALSATLLPGRAGPVLIEGNVVPGSALDDTATPKEIATFRERCKNEDHRPDARKVLAEADGGFVRYLDDAAPSVRKRLFEVESVGATFAHEYTTGRVTGFLTEKETEVEASRVDIVRRWRLKLPSAGAWEVVS